MKTIAYSILLLIASIEAVKVDKEAFFRASEKCLETVNVPEVFHIQFISMDFNDEPIARTYLHCLAVDLALWHDSYGFNEVTFARLAKDEPYFKDLFEVIKKCNEKPKDNPPPERAFIAYDCIMHTNPGMQLKKDLCKAFMDH